MYLVVPKAPAQVPVQSPVVTVGPNVQVSVAKGSTMHGEGVIATDPTDSRRLLVCSMFRDEDIGQGVAAYASQDGGAHWERTFESTLDNLAGDPACAFGADGTAYLTMIPLKVPRQATIRLPVYRSQDSGRTWRRVGETGYVDRESLVVDRTGGRFHNRIYVHGVASLDGISHLTRDALKLYVSADGGRTFGRPAERASFGRGFIFGVGNSVVLSDGRWLAVFGELKAYWDAADSSISSRSSAFPPPPEPENAWLKSVTSDDGGDSLNEPTTVSGWHMPNVHIRQSIATPTVAADGTIGPFNDRVYVVWPDSRFDGTNILFSYSADRGRTWSSAIVVNDDRRRWPSAMAPNHLLPAVAVNRAGVVAVTWLDRREASDNLGWRTRVRVSVDGGETFLPSTAVSEVPARFDGHEHWPSTASTIGGGTPVFTGDLLRVLIFAPLHLYFPGDYASVAADRDGTFHPYWIDNRTGWHQVWTAPLGVTAKAFKNGSGDLSELDDLTALTTLDRVASSYDQATQTASVTVRLENTSKQTVQGPFKIRLIDLDSDVAIVEAVGATNGATSAGAVWDVTSYVDGSRLEPGTASRPVTLAFELHDVRPFVQGHTDRFDLRLVTFFARVLGHISK
jgi:hypothetical protein